MHFNNLISNLSQCSNKTWKVVHKFAWRSTAKQEPKVNLILRVSVLEVDKLLLNFIGNSLLVLKLLFKGYPGGSTSRYTLVLNKFNVKNQLLRKNNFINLLERCLIVSSTINLANVSTKLSHRIIFMLITRQSRPNKIEFLLAVWPLCRQVKQIWIGL